MCLDKNDKNEMIENVNFLQFTYIPLLHKKIVVNFFIEKKKNLNIKVEKEKKINVKIKVEGDGLDV